MNCLNRPRDAAYKIDPVLWVHEVLGVTPAPWQEQFLRSPLGSTILALTARQVGKTTVAAWVIAHTMLFKPGSLSVIASPAQSQSAEAVRHVRKILEQVGAEFKTNNVFNLELKNGSRVRALPGDDDTVRGLTVDGWIIADEAARLDENMISALRPMRARRPEARFAMLSTAWSRTDPFWKAWSDENFRCIRLKCTADWNDCPISKEKLEEERQALGENAFKREFLGIPVGSGESPFTWDLYERAIDTQEPRIPPGGRGRASPDERVVPLPNPFQELQQRGVLS